MSNSWQMGWFGCIADLPILFFRILWIKIEYSWVLQDVWLTPATRRGRLLPFSQLSGFTGAHCERLWSGLKHACMTKHFSKIQAGDQQKPCGQSQCPQSELGAWAFATLTSLCQGGMSRVILQGPGALWNDSWISLQWGSFVFKWEGYFSSRE